MIKRVAGLSGLGDLVLTCTGSQSRNHRLGLAIAKGLSLAQAEGSTPMVAEGVRTVASARMLAAPGPVIRTCVSRHSVAYGVPML